MDNESTDYQKPLEARQAAFNPYDSNPYDRDIPIPPPPPRQGHKGLLVALISGVCLVLLLVGVLFAVLHLQASQGIVRATPAPRTTPTSIATATPTAQPYDATSIIHDFQTQGLPVDQVQYGISIDQYFGVKVSNTATESSAALRDPTISDPAYNGVDVWLGVYNSPGDAQAAEQDVILHKTYIDSLGPQSQSPDFMVQFGRCLLIGESATSEYVAIVRKDCT